MGRLAHPPECLAAKPRTEKGGREAAGSASDSGGGKESEVMRGSPIFYWLPSGKLT